jgi:hypothetical protein
LHEREAQRVSCQGQVRADLERSSDGKTQETGSGDPTPPPRAQSDAGERSSRCES